jgi:hypothetical protein
MELKKLLVIWTSDNREVTLNACFMYTYNAKFKFGWERVRLIVWGPSGRLLAEDEEVQAELKKMADVGVEIVVCQKCADQLGTHEALEKIDGIYTIYKVGPHTTDMLMDDSWRVLVY